LVTRFIWRQWRRQQQRQQWLNHLTWEMGNKRRPGSGDGSGPDRQNAGEQDDDDEGRKEREVPAVMNRPSDRCGSGGARVTAYDTDTPKGLVSPYRIVRLIPSRSYCYCPKSTEAALSQPLPESGTDLTGSSARPGERCAPRAAPPPPTCPLSRNGWGVSPEDDETASPLRQARDACVTGQPSDSSLIVIAPLRAWFLGYPWLHGMHARELCSGQRWRRR
jgi:hypothetical protein